MRSLICGFVAGAWCLQQQAQLPPAPGWSLLAVLLLCRLLWQGRRLNRSRLGLPVHYSAAAEPFRDTNPADCPENASASGQATGFRLRAAVFFTAGDIVMRMLAGAALGFYWAAWLAAQTLSASLPAALEGQTLQLQGVVTDLPYHFDGGTRFQFTPQSQVVQGRTRPLPANFPVVLLVSWYQGGTVAAGECWRLTLRLQRPHGNANPDGFDYELWLLEQGVRATGYVRDGKSAAAGTAGQPGSRNNQPAAGATDMARHGSRLPGAISAGDASGTGAAAKPGTAAGLAQDSPGERDERDERNADEGAAQDLAVAGENQRLARFVWRPSTVVARAREWLRERMHAALPEARYAGVLVALVLGDQRAISQSDWTLFNQTGVGHLMSISGLHITMVAGLMAGCVNFLWRRSFFTRAQLPLLLPAQQVAALTACLTALLYVALTGFGVPAQRTLIMLSVVAAAIWFDRISSVSHVLCVALALVVLLDPWAVLWPGFWLSFGAVALILYASAGRTAPLQRRWLREVRSAIHTQYIVTLGLLPLSLLLFSQYSWVSPLANALAIPLVSFVVTPLALLGSILPDPLCGPVLWLAHAVLAWLIQLLAQLAAHGVWSAPQPAAWMFALALGGVLCLLAPRGWPARWLGVTLFLPLLLNRPATPPPGQFWLTVFDVGQGTAVLVETAGHRLLYDSGPQYSAFSDGGNRVILPYLKTRGIHGLDALIISHRDNDHAGGAVSILQALPTGAVLSSLEDSHPVVQAASRNARDMLSHATPVALPPKDAAMVWYPGPGPARCAAGQRWEWEGVRFEMLHPQAASYPDQHVKSNARSCTLKVSSPAGSVLLPGDIEKAQEQALLQDQPGTLASTVLLAPHHGSGTSSSLAFLEAVHPRMALFQVGYRNRYHHPKAEVYERYGQLGIARWRTDESGALELRFGADLTIAAYRQSHARYWYGR